jgi:hypothetical protein
LPYLLLLAVPMTLLFSRLRAAQRSIPLAGEQKEKREAVAGVSHETPRQLSEPPPHRP